MDLRCRPCGSLGKLSTLKDGIPHHAVALVRSTVFGAFIDMPPLSISEPLLRMLVASWDDSRNGFDVGGHFIPFSLHDVIMILGLPCTGEGIRLGEDYDECIFTRLCQRLGITVHGKVDNVYQILHMHMKELDDVEVFVCVVVVVLSELLFPLPSNNINSSLFPYLDNPHKVNGYAWGTAVYEFTIEGIRKAYKAMYCSNRAEVRIAGCALLLQVWALEHLKFCEPDNNNAWPRVLRYTRKSLPWKEMKQCFKVGKTYKRFLDFLHPTNLELKEDIVIASLQSSAVDSNAAAAPFQDTRDAACVTDDGEDGSDSRVTTQHIPCTGAMLYLPDWKMKYDETVGELDETRRMHAQLSGRYDDLHATHMQLVSDLQQLSLRADFNRHMLVDRLSHDPYYKPTTPIRDDMDGPTFPSEAYWTPPRASVYHGTHRHVSKQDPRIYSPMGEGEGVVSPSGWAKSSSNIEKRVKKNPRMRRATTRIREDFIVPSPYHLRPVNEVDSNQQWVMQHIFYMLDSNQRALVEQYANMDLNGGEDTVVRFANGATINGTNLQALVAIDGEGEFSWLSTDVIDNYVDLILSKLRSLGIHGVCIFTATVGSWISSCCIAKSKTTKMQPCQSVLSILGRYENVNMVIIPFCHQGHFQVLVCNTQQKQFYALDSLQGATHFSVSRSVKQWMGTFIFPSFSQFDDSLHWDISRPNCLVQQQNGSDCGVFALMYTICYAMGVDVPALVTVDNVINIRHRMLIELLEGHLLP